MSSSIFDFPEEMLSADMVDFLEELRLAGADLLCHRHGRWELLQEDKQGRTPAREVRIGLRFYVALSRTEHGGWDVTLYRLDVRGGGADCGNIDGFVRAAQVALKAFVKEDVRQRLVGSAG